MQCWHLDSLALDAMCEISYNAPMGKSKASIELGNRIVVRRLPQTQKTVAKRAGIRRETLADIERGVGNPQYSTLLAIAAALGTTVADLVK